MHGTDVATRSGHAGDACGYGDDAGDGRYGDPGNAHDAGRLADLGATQCAEGAGTGIGSGTVSWVTVTLPPGRYELICNLPNRYADGMRQAVTVR
ncbi:hypothetical protein SAMN05892883_1641 [Jatrophihabitans sp. GAS493]|nr:hypothetical protein SAMN05892883_1641 [Jatrophihabitans sp. GAS493]